MHDAWPIVKLGSLIADISAGVSVSGLDRRAIHGEHGILTLSAVVDSYFNPNANKAVDPSISSTLGRTVRGGTILISRSNTIDLVGSAAFVTKDYPTLHLPDLLWEISVPDDNNVCPEWLSYLLQSPSIRTALKSRASGTSGNMKKLSMRVLRQMDVPQPSIDEQRIIGRLLEKWDSGIEKASRLLTLKRRLRRGLTQQLLAGGCRFPEFAGQPLPRVRLGDVMKKVVQPVTPTHDELYRQIGVRSHGKGLFHKPAVTGASLGSKRVFRVIPGCLTLNIIFAWERALGLITEHEADMIASHRFPMFRPDPSKILAEYALLYLLSERGVLALKLASPGGAGRNRTLNQNQFLKTLIPLPSLAEQRKIAAISATADREIKLLEQQLAALREQKKGLMQKLLTGQVRVKVPKEAL